MKTRNINSNRYYPVVRIIGEILTIVWIGLMLISCERSDLAKKTEGIERVEDSTNDSRGPQKNSITGLSVWHWGSETRVNGINHVILDELKSKETIDHYLKNKVTRIYGGYSKIPAHSSQKEYLAKWNTKLQQAGIKSIYLVGNAQWIYPENRQNMLDHITSYYIKFNESVDSTSKLMGLHLDIEPHQLKEWASASLKRKRELLNLLKDTYRDLRTLLVNNGMRDEEIMADIPTWFDETSAIGWSSEAEKQQWFDEVAIYLSGFTIMAYELDDIATIVNRTIWERKNFKGIIQIGLNADEIGPIWTGKSDIIRALNEIALQTKVSTALHDYTKYMEQ